MDWGILRKNWVEEIIGGKIDDFDISLNLKVLFSELENEAEEYEKSIVLDGTNIWQDIEWIESADLTTAYTRIACMARAYDTYGTKYYQNNDIKEKILFALEWMYQNRYGNNVLKGDGWRRTDLFNWWDWAIGAPRELIDTMMIMYDELSYIQICDYLKAFDFQVPKVTDYGANRIDFAIEKIGSAVLRQDRETVLIALAAIEDMFKYCDDGANDGQGVYSDGTYIFHTKHPMNGTYGLSFMSTVVKLAKILKESEFAFSDEITKMLMNWYEKGYMDVFQYGSVVRMMYGRHHMAENGGAGLISLGLNCLPLDPNNKKIKRFIKSNYGFTMDTAKDNISDIGRPATYTFEYIKRADQIIMLDELMKDNNIECTNEEFSHVYYFCDKVIHQRENYTFTVSMSSSRVFNYECINHENMTGWYIGDGMTSLYNRNNTYKSKYWKNINPYYIPGTTVDSQKREAVSIRQSNEYLSGQDFVGGTTLDNRYTVCAMALESYHSDGNFSPDDKFPDQPAEYGIAPPKHDCDLTAKKAWFMFDDEIVCLGTDITSTDNSDVRTVVYNNTNACIQDKDTVKAQGHCTIKFINDTKYVVKNDDFTIITVEHGKNPCGEKYAYIVYPSEEINNNIEIIENSSTVQAVKNNKLDMAQFVFWGAGQCTNVSVSESCIIIISRDRIAACDPTHKNRIISIKIGEKDYEFDFRGTNGKTIERDK